MTDNTIPADKLREVIDTIKNADPESEYAQGEQREIIAVLEALLPKPRTLADELREPIFTGAHTASFSVPYLRALADRAEALEQERDELSYAREEGQAEIEKIREAHAETQEALTASQRELRKLNDSLRIKWKDPKPSRKIVDGGVIPPQTATLYAEAFPGLKKRPRREEIEKLISEPFMRIAAALGECDCWVCRNFSEAKAEEKPATSEGDEESNVLPWPFINPDVWARLRRDLEEGGDSRRR